MLLSLLLFGATLLNSDSRASAAETFSGDVAFLQLHTDIVLLQRGDATVAIAPAYQGRVMTSTFDRQAGCPPA